MRLLLSVIVLLAATMSEPWLRTCVADETRPLARLVADTPFVAPKRADGDKPVGTFQAGTSVRVWKASGDWLLVQDEEGRTGWIARSAVDPATEKPFSLNALALHLLISKNAGTNRLVNTQGIAESLSVLAEAARGDTRQELRQLIGQDSASDSSAKTLGEFDGGRFRSHLALWKRSDLNLSAEFSEFAHGRGIEIFRDVGTGAQAADAVNRWVTKATNGLVDNLIAPGAIMPETELVLANANTFEARWVHRFDRNYTQPGRFFVTPGKPKQASLMSMVAELPLQRVADGKFTALCLPYGTESNVGKESVEGIICLPDDATSPDAVADWLSVHGLPEFSREETIQRVQVTLPRFDIQGTISLSEGPLRRKLPITFSDQADFSGFGSKTAVQATTMIQKSRLIVDEWGTVAASGTAVSIGASGPSKSTVQFRVDRPFLMLIHHRPTGVLWMAAKITDPGQPPAHRP